MLKRVFPVLSLALAACAADSSESASSSMGEDLHAVSAGGGTLVPVSAANLAVTPTDTTFLISYVPKGGPTSFNVVLTGPSGPTTLTGSSSVLFTGLVPCTSYTYAIQYNGSTVLGGAGQANTRLSGTTVCPTSEKLAASVVHTFRGVNHQQGGTVGCGGGTWPSFPLGTGWVYHEDIGGGMSANVGAYHFDDPGSGPFPCSESLDDVYRARFDFTLTPLQLRRLSDASFVANYANESGSNACVRWNEEMHVMLTTVPAGNYSAVSANGNTWPSALGRPLTSQFLQQPGTAGPEQMVVAANGQMSIDFGRTTLPALQVGLRENDDGLDLVNGVYARDNNRCVATLTNAGLVLTYADLPPETPTSCSVATNCDTASVTCNNSPDSFTLYRTVTTRGAAVTTAVATVRGSAGAGTVSMTDTGYDGTAQYQVCARTNPSDAATACSPVSVVTSAVACACTPITCYSAANKECGSFSDGCGGTVNCGSCSSGMTCQNGACVGGGGTHGTFCTQCEATGGICTVTGTKDVCVHP